MVEPCRAAVRPRVKRDGEAVLLEDEVRARLQSCPRGFVAVCGAAGAGKSTALAHLADLFDLEPRLALFDDNDARPADEMYRLAAIRLVVGVMPAADPSEMQVVPDTWWLAPWTTDDCIEYVLAAHHDCRERVLLRYHADLDRVLLKGLPELCRAVLDRFATDAFIDIKEALRREVQARVTSPEVLEAARQWCFVATCHPDRKRWMLGIDECEGITPQACALLRHDVVQHLLAADHVAAELRSQSSTTVLDNRLPPFLVHDVAALTGGDRIVRNRLIEVLTRASWLQQPMAASLLHAMFDDWTPPDGQALRLSGAYLSGVSWPGIRLQNVQFAHADLAGADLNEAELQGILAREVCLEQANLHGARLKKLTAPRAMMAGVDLSFAQAEGAELPFADMRGANLEGARLHAATVRGADFRGANCRRADFSHTVFSQPVANLEDADFTGANMTACLLNTVVLRHANFSGAQFSGARLRRADLEGMKLPGANFEQADLEGAYLTGTYMPDACFRGANLANTGLAEIDWERADLRDADLQSSTFHLGSSRSGLVGSPIACEGSRTGFYTDELNEQDFKAPEEIRKANLRGADLRGAQIDGLDFYLVDLRNARYTPDQEKILRATGAILKTRV